MQFGFRAHHSIETACCYFLGVIKTALIKVEVVGAVFLGLYKAFYVVSYSEPEPANGVLGCQLLRSAKFLWYTCSSD